RAAAGKSRNLARLTSSPGKLRPIITVEAVPTVLAVLSRLFELLAEIWTQDLLEPLLLHVAMFFRFRGDLVGNLSRANGDTVFVPMQQVAGVHLHTVDGHRRAHVIDRRPAMRHDQTPTVIVEAA